MNEPSPNVKFSLDEVLQILKNAGVDVTCGACAEVAFTGATLATHTCSAVGRGVGFLSTAREIPKGCTISIEGNQVLIRADEVILGYIENKGGGMYQWRSTVRDACAHEILKEPLADTVRRRLAARDDGRMVLGNEDDGPSSIRFLTKESERQPAPVCFDVIEGRIHCYVADPKLSSLMTLCMSLRTGATTTTLWHGSSSPCPARSWPTRAVCAASDLIWRMTQTMGVKSDKGSDKDPSTTTPDAAK